MFLGHRRHSSEITRGNPTRKEAREPPSFVPDSQAHKNAAEQIRGNNLFHSFSEFNVNTGQTATFTGPNSIANIINRVTGQNPSNIDGGINSRAAMPGANLFLINQTAWSSAPMPVSMWAARFISVRPIMCGWAMELNSLRASRNKVPLPVRR
jgi:filamentous hemagglutinin family protein